MLNDKTDKSILTNRILWDDYAKRNYSRICKFFDATTFDLVL